MQVASTNPNSGATLAPIHLANDAGELDIHAVNAARAEILR